MGWIGVDLDGTLAKYDKFEGDTIIGEPTKPETPGTPSMVERVKKWLEDGKEVRIMTARASGENSEAAKEAIEKWCEKYIGQKLPVTNIKDQEMKELWDDRAIQVKKNTGEPVVKEEHPIYQKISEGTVTAEDFNKLLSEATPESLRDRVRRRIMPQRDNLKSHQDKEGHSDLKLPKFADRVQPKRKPSGNTQMHGRGKVGHRHSTKTQRKKFDESVFPERFQRAIRFISDNIGKEEYSKELSLLEDKSALKHVINNLMTLPNINREWLHDLRKNIGG